MSNRLNKLSLNLFFFLFVGIIFIGSNSNLTKAQELFTWKLHTNKQLIRDAILVNGVIWAATDGGVFAYTIKDSSYQAFTKSEGLAGSFFSAIAIDTSGRIWVGSKNGIIDVINPVDLSVHSSYDIYSTNNVNKQIYNLDVKGDSVFVSTDFGLTIVQASTYNTLDSYQKLGSVFASNTKVTSSVYINNRLFVATVSGLAVEKANSKNPAAPESWDDYYSTNGFSASSINAIGQYNGSILIATEKGFYRYTDVGLDYTFIPELHGNVISGFSTKGTNGDSLIILSGGQLYLYYQNTLSTPFAVNNGAAKAIISISDDQYFATDKGIFVYRKDGSSAYLYPNGPSANQFISISVDTKSSVWCASGKDVTGVGAYQYDGKNWVNHNQTTIPGFPSNGVFNIYSAPDGYTYFNTWGQGYIKFGSPTNYTQYTYGNTPLVGISANLAYVVISDTKMDSKGSLWSIILESASGKILNCNTADSTWYSLPNYSDSSVTGVYYKLAIDQNDTKWFSQNAALFFFNENSSFGKPSKYSYGNLSTNAALDGKAITDLSIDKRGELWIGTNLGVYSLSDPSQALNYDISSLTLDQKFPLRQYTINCMAVDALNRKWIGTEQGLLLVSSDGTTVLNSFNSKNSPLITDGVRAIAIDEKKGKVYVGLDAALAEISTFAIKPADDYSNMFTFPSPYLLSDAAQPLTIEGLMKDSEIKIIDVTGNLIRTISTLGGYKAQWDGRNNDNNLVSSGVYIVVAYNKDGNSIGTKKIAVIRK